MDWLQLAFIAAMMCVFYALGRAIKSRFDRWFRLTISLPLLLLAMQPTFVAPFFIAALAYLWAGRIARLLAGSVTSFIYGHGSQSAGHIPNYKYAREKALDGEHEEAIKLCRWELDKQPDNYEGLILLATIYMETQRPNLALEQVELILRTPHLGDRQEQEALRAKAECLNALH